MRFVHSGISFLLVLFILAGSAGLRVFKHACEEDGIFTSYFVQLEDHCGEHIEKLPECCQQEHIEKDDCCSDEVDIYQVEFDYYQDFSVEFAIFSDLESPSDLFYEYFPVLQTSSNSTVTRPPPLILGGKDILIKNQVFRI